MLVHGLERDIPSMREWKQPESFDNDREEELESPPEQELP